MPQERIFSIILAGGRGTRMRSDSTHKLCFEVGGVPVMEDSSIRHFLQITKPPEALYRDGIDFLP